MQISAKTAANAIIQKAFWFYDRNLYSDWMQSFTKLEGWSKTIKKDQKHNSMTRLTLPFLISLISLSTIGAYGQDIRKAAIQYFTNQPSEFDRNIILQSKIKSLHRQEINYDAWTDSINSRYPTETHHFNQFGNPEHVLKYQNGNEVSEIQYLYDEDGRLIKKEIYEYAGNKTLKLAEYYEWLYVQNYLTRQRHYMKSNDYSSNRYNPILYTNDSILYNQEDQSCLVMTNNPANFQNLSRTQIQSLGKFSVNTTLKFYPNGGIFTETVQRDTISRTKTYDECGNLIPRQIKPTPKCQTFLGNPANCLTDQTIRICNEVDTTRLNGELVFYSVRLIEHFQPNSGNGTTTSTHWANYYNKDFKLIYQESTANWQEGPAAYPLSPANPNGQAIPPSSTPLPTIPSEKYGDPKHDFPISREATDFRTYEYFENGLTKRVVTRNHKRKVIQEVVTTLEYFD